jgi:hypothetical protein
MDAITAAAVPISTPGIVNNRLDAVELVASVAIRPSSSPISPGQELARSWALVHVRGLLGAPRIHAPLSAPA